MYLASLVSARLLGPEAFGQISFALVVAQLLSLLAVRGLDFASGRFLVMSTQPSEVRDLVGTAYSVAAGGAVVGGALLLASAGIVSEALGWSRLSVVGAALLLLPVSLKSLNERLLPAVNLTTTLAAVRPIEGGALLVAIGVIVLTGSVTPATILGAVVGAGLLVVALLMGRLASRRLVGSFRSSAHRRLKPYANVVLMMTLVPLPLQFGDRLAIQWRLSETDLGLYVACATATQLIAAQVVALLSGVLLPHVLRDGPPAIDRLRRASRLLLVPAAAGFFLALLLSLALLGSSYSPPVALTVVFSILAAVQLGNGLLHVAVLAHPATLRTDVRITAVRAVVYVVALLGLAWSDRLSLVTVAATLLASEAVQAIVLWRLTDRASRGWSSASAVVQPRP